VAAKPGLVDFEALMGGVTESSAAAAGEELKVKVGAEERMPVAVPSVVLNETGDIHNNANDHQMPRSNENKTERIELPSYFILRRRVSRAARERCSQGQQSHHWKLAHGKISDG
jgi:hypothetical protein